jgi:uncharacterized protein YndB with AHSA1/START domain
MLRVRGISGRASIDIAAPPEAVWEYLVDAEKQEAWMGDTVEWLPADRSRLRAGYRATEIMPTPGKPSESQVEVLEHDPPHRLRTSHAHELFTATAAYRLEPGGAGTRFSTRVHIRYSSWATWLKVAIVGPMYSRLMRQSLKRLRDLVERGAPGPAS